MTSTTTLTMDQANKVTALVNELDALDAVAGLEPDALAEHVDNLSDTLTNEVLGGLEDADGNLPVTLSNGVHGAASAAMANLLDAVCKRIDEVKAELAALGVAVVDQNAAQGAEQSGAAVDQPQTQAEPNPANPPAATDLATVTGDAATTTTEAA